MIFYTLLFKITNTSFHTVPCAFFKSIPVSIIPSSFHVYMCAVCVCIYPYFQVCGYMSVHISLVVLLLYSLKQGLFQSNQNLPTFLVLISILLWVSQFCLSRLELQVVQQAHPVSTRCSDDLTSPSLIWINCLIIHADSMFFFYKQPACWNSPYLILINISFLFLIFKLNFVFPISN